MALFNSSKVLCKCACQQWPSLIARSCRPLACLQSKVYCLRIHQLAARENLQWRVEDLPPCNDIEKTRDIFVYRPIKASDRQEFPVLTLQRKQWQEQLLKDGKQPTVTTWNHDEQIDDILLHYSLTVLTCQGDSMGARVKLMGGDGREETLQVKSENIVTAKDVNKTELNTKGETGQDAPGDMQMEKMFNFLSNQFHRYFAEPVNFDVYHKNIAFVNSITGLTTRGLPAYKSIMFMAKYTLLLCMTDLCMEVLKITKHSNDNTIKVRWRIRGQPRLWAWVGSRAKDPSRERYRYLDGFSVFEVGSDGLVHCHRLHKVMPSPPRKEESPLWVLNSLAVLELQRRTGEVLGMFECRSTDEDGPEGITHNCRATPVAC